MNQDDIILLGQLLDELDDATVEHYQELVKKAKIVFDYLKKILVIKFSAN